MSDCFINYTNCTVSFVSCKGVTVALILHPLVIYDEFPSR